MPKYADFKLLLASQIAVIMQKAWAQKMKYSIHFGSGSVAPVALE